MSDTNLELDLSSQVHEREAERFESVVVKQASPTTERPPKLSPENGFSTENGLDRIVPDNKLLPEEASPSESANFANFDEGVKISPVLGSGDAPVVSTKSSSEQVVPDMVKTVSSTDSDIATSDSIHSDISSFEMLSQAQENSLDNEKLNSINSDEAYSLVEADENGEDNVDDMPPLEYDSKSEESRLKSKSADTADSKSKNDDESKADNGDTDEWVDILGNGALKKKVLIVGAGRDTRPGPSDRVTVNIAGRLESGQSVDEHQQLQFSLGEGEVIPALDMALALTEVKETCEVYTEAKYAYGKLGSPPEIPTDADITYTLTLTDVKPPLDADTLSLDERIKLGDAKRERGNYYFGRNEHPPALNCYTKALELLNRPGDGAASSDTDKLQLLHDTKAKCYNNQAAAQIKIEAFDAAIKSCDDVLRIQPDNVKALFRKGKALGNKGELDDAIAVLRKALKIEPESKLIHQELSRLVGEQRSENDKQRDMYKRMIGTDKQTPKPEPDNTMLMLIMTALVLLLALLVGAYLYYLQTRNQSSTTGAAA